MADGVPSGWLPPTAPGAGPAPRFEPPHDQPQVPEPSGPTFVKQSPAGPRERNVTAVWALILGIVGLTVLLLSFGTLFAFTVPCSVAAWALALRARRQLGASGSGAGAGQATAALWLGRIGVMAGIAAMVILIALVASGFDFEQLRIDLENELDQRRERQGDGGVDGVRT